MKSKTCCITGHRTLDINKIEFIKSELKCAIIDAIEQGYCHFISGFAEGVDLYFADIVSELKSEFNITLEAAIPYTNRINSRSSEFQRLLHNCDLVRIHSDKYSPNCYMIRNKFMVNSSNLVIAVYDNRESGGTFATIKYANALRKIIHQINI